MWRTHLKPRRVPEHGQVVLHHIAPIAHLPCCRQQHLTTFPQHIQCLAVERIRNKDFSCGSKLFTLRVYPKVPMIPKHPAECDCQRQLCGFDDFIERENHCSEVQVLAHRQLTESKGTTCHHLLLVIGDIIGTAHGVDSRYIGIIHLDGHPQRITSSIDELGELCQWHNPVTKLPPFLVIDIAFLLPMHVQHTF